jgi:hypothetical protein
MFLMPTLIVTDRRNASGFPMKSREDFPHLRSLLPRWDAVRLPRQLETMPNNVWLAALNPLACKNSICFRDSSMRMHGDLRGSVTRSRAVAQEADSKGAFGSVNAKPRTKRAPLGHLVNTSPRISKHRDGVHLLFFFESRKAVKMQRVTCCGLGSSSVLWLRTNTRIGAVWADIRPSTCYVLKAANKIPRAN